MLSASREQFYSYADILEWDGDIRYELYDGVPVALASPNSNHQIILRELLLQLGNYLKGKKCEVYPAPLDVRLFEKAGDQPEDVDTVVQPDLMVVCDEKKIDRRGVHGAPDLIIEILSESTARYDLLVKLNKYQTAGVREYWIVDPALQMVSVYTLENGQYRVAAYDAEEHIPVGILDGFQIDMGAVFAEIP